MMKTGEYVSVRTGWRKASASDTQGACVEVPQQLDALRDSKNAGGPILVVGSGFSALISALKADQPLPIS